MKSNLVLFSERIVTKSTKNTEVQVNVGIYIFQINIYTQMYMMYKAMRGYMRILVE